MSKQKSISINGVMYDAHTGLRLSDDAQPAPRSDTHSGLLHHKQSRTQTLSRSHVRSPHTTAHVSKAPRAVKQQTAKVERSPMIQKFAKQAPSQAARPVSGRVISDIAPVKHPLQTKAEERITHKKASTAQTRVQPKPAHQIKQHSIEKALHNAKPAKKEKQSFAKRHPRLVSVSSASMAILLLGGYLTYLNLPNISVRIAAAQAGIAATYPSYQPSGYSLNGPVAYSDGQVSMKFAANVGPQDFMVNQVKSNWDSTALLENYVEQASEGDYQTLRDSGLTIYTYDGDAAWVNGGILHTIQGDAPLSPDQIRKIATSM